MKIEPNLPDGTNGLTETWIIFLEINPQFQRAFQAAKELGLRTLLISSEDRDSEVESSIDSFEKVDVLSFESVVSILERRSDIHQIAAFWTLWDTLIPLSSKLTRKFGKHQHGYSDKLVRLTKNKFEMREALLSTTYNPNYCLLASTYEGPNPTPEKTIVLKPVLGYSSIGVEKVRPNDDFGAAFRRTCSVLEKINLSISSFESGMDYDSNHSIVCEEFIEGKEFSAEIFANQNKICCLGICGKSEMTPPFFEEISYCLPAPLDRETQSRIETAAIEIMQVLGLTSGMAHVEFRMKGNQPIVLDIGLRLGGLGLTHDLVQASSGIDLVKAVLAELGGFDSDPYLIPISKDIGLLYLVQVGCGGRVAQIPDFQLALDIHSLSKEFLWAQYLIKKGDCLTGYPDHSGLPGFAMFKVSGQNEASYLRVQEVLRVSPEVFGIEYCP